MRRTSERGTLAANRSKREISTMMTQVKDYVVEHEKIAEHWKTCFSQLASLTNRVISGSQECYLKPSQLCFSSIHQMKLKFL